MMHERGWPYRLGVDSKLNLKVMRKGGGQVLLAPISFLSSAIA